MITVVVCIVLAAILFAVLWCILSGPVVTQEQKVEEVMQRIKEASIGEPVVTLAKSILETDDWEESTPAPYSSSIVFPRLRHKAKALEVKFCVVLRTKYHNREIIHMKEVECLTDWMTPAEKEYMADVFSKYQAKQKQIAERKHQEQMAEERRKFAVLVNEE